MTTFKKEIYADDELLFDHRPRGTAHSEIWVYDFETAEGRSLLASDFGQLDPILSPDGRWLAYESAESGASEVWTCDLSPNHAHHI